LKIATKTVISIIGTYPVPEKDAALLNLHLIPSVDKLNVTMKKIYVTFSGIFGANSYRGSTDVFDLKHTNIIKSIHTLENFSIFYWDYFEAVPFS
jgi:hypothetical protein